MKLKRFAAGFVAAVMALAVLGTPLGDILPFVRESVATTAGAEKYIWGAFSYDILDDGTVVITRYNGYGGDAKTVDIPSEIDGKIVTKIGDWAFSGSYSLERIVIPYGVKSIGAAAFNCCDSLKSITISNSVTNIGELAFQLCSSLISITIPANVTNIGNNAFAHCISLNEIDVDENNQFYINDNGILFSTDKSRLIKYSSKKTEENFEIPDNVSHIDGYAFYGCNLLRSITIPYGVTSIERYTFYKCSSLTSIIIPNSVTSIDGCAFSSCTSLASITIPDSVTRMGYSAFSDCESLKSITIPDGVTIIAPNIFENCRSLVSVTIPKGVTSIASSAFAICTNLVSITIPEGVVSIGREAFYSCHGLRNITIPASLKRDKIESYAFLHCYAIKHIHIPNGTTYSDYSGSGGLPIKSEYYFELSEYGSCPDENCPMGMHQPDGPIKTSYNLKITDSKGYALKNAIVVCGDKTYDVSNGVVHISNPGSASIIINANGYKSVKVSLNTLSTGSVNTVSLISASSAVNASLSNIYFSEKSNIDMVYDNGSIGTYISTGKATDVLHGVKTIDLKRTSSGHTSYYDFYLYCAGNTSGISSYKVYNGNKLLSSSSSNKIKISTSQLKDNSNLKVVCLLNDGNSLTYNINVKANDNSNDFSSFQLSG